jgi:hypothetical protein
MTATFSVITPGIPLVLFWNFGYMNGGTTTSNFDTVPTIGLPCPPGKADLPAVFKPISIEDFPPAYG